MSEQPVTVACAGIFPRGADLCRQHFPGGVNIFFVLFQTRHEKHLVINFSLLKLVSTQRCTHSPLTPLLPAVSQPPPLLLWWSTRPSAVNLYLSCWRSFSPLPNQRSSSSNPPAGGHIHPCPLSGNPISACSQPHPSPSSGHPLPPHAGGHIHLCMPSGHPLTILLAVIFSPACPAVIL